jgi:hypothetical protein
MIKAMVAVFVLLQHGSALQLRPALPSFTLTQAQPQHHPATRPLYAPSSIASIPSTRRSSLGLYLVPGIYVDPQIMSNLQPALISNSIIASILFFSKQKSLTRAGLAHAYALGLGLWTFLGFEGWSIGAAYFVLGSIFTKIKMKEKEVNVS